MLRAPSFLRLRSFSLGLLLLVVLAASAQADSPGSILHEFLPPDPSDDVTSAATLDDGIPAAVQTPSGLATAPDPRRPPGTDHVYGGGTTDDGPDSTYEPDRDTRRPHVENYDDPFTPATAPFKRLRAFDWIEGEYAFRVRDKALRKVPLGGSLSLGDEPFYGDLSVDLIPGEPVRIPTVGPAARILRMHVNPEQSVEVLHDGADNWFVRGTDRTRVRLVMELAIPRDTFGRDFDDVDWPTLDAVEALASRNSGVPTSHVHDAAVTEVAQAIGISRAQRPSAVVRRMAEYFRDFVPSEVPPRGHKDIFLDLALSKKGVCRHRAFAFLVTALGMGIPARMVANEAHAWVEVNDGRLWHRIDLGGAAANLDSETEPNRPGYVPPPDPYGWPGNRDSGQDLAEKNRAQTQSNTGRGPSSNQSGGGGASPGTSPGPLPQGPVTGEPSNTSSPPNPGNGLPQSDITVVAIDSAVRRGVPLHIKGTVSSGRIRCSNLRLDVVLVNRATAGRSGPHQGTAVGSLSTDEHGQYDGAVVIPRDFSLGDYDLVVQTAGDARCGVGRTR